MFVGAIIVFGLVANVFGKMLIQSPKPSSVFAAGSPITIGWVDDGTAPLLKDYGPAIAKLIIGGVQNQVALQTLSSNLDVTANPEFTFTVDASLGPDSDSYFVGVTFPKFPDTTVFSAKFTLTGMTGSPAGSSTIASSSTLSDRTHAISSTASNSVNASSSTTHSSSTSKSSSTASSSSAITTTSLSSTTTTTAATSSTPSGLSTLTGPSAPVMPNPPTTPSDSSTDAPAAPTQSSRATSIGANTVVGVSAGFLAILSLAF